MRDTLRTLSRGTQLPQFALAPQSSSASSKLMGILGLSASL
jgi:hypothetical protein